MPCARRVFSISRDIPAQIKTSTACSASARVRFPLMVKSAWPARARSSISTRRRDWATSKTGEMRPRQIGIATLISHGESNKLAKAGAVVGEWGKSVYWDRSTSSRMHRRIHRLQIASCGLWGGCILRRQPTNLRRAHPFQFNRDRPIEMEAGDLDIFDIGPATPTGLSSARTNLWILFMGWRLDFQRLDFSK